MWSYSNESSVGIVASLLITLVVLAIAALLLMLAWNASTKFLYHDITLPGVSAPDRKLPYSTALLIVLALLALKMIGTSFVIVANK